MQDRHHDLGRADALRVLAYRNAATIVLDAHRAIEVNDDVDYRAMTGEMFIDRVVDGFPDEMVQA